MTSTLHGAVERLLTDPGTRLTRNPAVSRLRSHALSGRTYRPARSHAIVSVTPPSERGRSPKDTFFVRDTKNAAGNLVNWGPPNFQEITAAAFDRLVSDTLQILKRSSLLYRVDRSVNADPQFSHPITVITPDPVVALFAHNMFRHTKEGTTKSVFAKESPHILLIDPHAKFDRAALGLPSFEAVDPTRGFIIASDFDRKITVVRGFGYLGPVKKAVFTQMSYELPRVGVLPMHCSANIGKSRDVALFFGLSGTGKTTLSNDPSRRMIGDDEHGWSDAGVFNLEGGQYPKVVGLDPTREPMLHHALFDERSTKTSPVILENVWMDREGDVDVHNTTLTENSRGSFPLNPDFVPNLVPAGRAGHPKHIFFITTDLSGILPPIAKLNAHQALLWYLLGPTSKVAGTEKGTKEPKSVFSRFFGDPFMPHKPDVYLSLFAKKLTHYNPGLWLINTGWTNGAYGTGRRIPLEHTRSLVSAAITGSLDRVPLHTHAPTGLTVPQSAPNVPDDLLDPKRGWNKNAYEKAAKTYVRSMRECFAKEKPGTFAEVLQKALPGSYSSL